MMAVLGEKKAAELIAPLPADATVGQLEQSRSAPSTAPAMQAPKAQAPSKLPSHRIVWQVTCRTQNVAQNHPRRICCSAQGCCFRKQPMAGYIQIPFICRMKVMGGCHDMTTAVHGVLN